MPSTPPVFVIPTYRLRDVGETVEAYDENFRNNGQAAKILVVDDSTVANHDKYYSVLERTKTANELFYVGPHEKEEFVGFLMKRLGDRKLEGTIRNLFRPSYGGNRNYTLIYTLGDIMISADDDMRPYALVEDSPESLAANEISRGKLLKATQGGFTRKSYDILASFEEVLGKTVAELPPNFSAGELVVDTAMDLETNASKGLAMENSLLLQPGKVPPSSIVKMAQTFRSGTNDVDALDFAELYLADDDQIELEAINDVYVLVNFRPVVTNKNWRMDCGVAGYDNRLGLPPFFPTRLRFEDYIYRLWIQQPGYAAAHVDSAQTHIKNTYMRNPLASEVFNEEIANLLKRKICASTKRLDDLGIDFRYDGEVTSKDSDEIIEKVRRIYERALTCAAATKREERAQVLRLFAYNLEKAFYGFEPDFVQQNMSRIVDDVLSQIRAGLEIWPTLVEICYYQRHKKELPRRRVRNHKRA